VGYVPKVELKIPAKGAAEGAMGGAKAGAMAPIQLASEAIKKCNDPVCSILLSGVGLVFAPVGAIVGGVGGSITADSAEVVNMRETKVKLALIDLRMQEHIRDRFSSRLADLKTFPIKTLPDAGPAEDGQKIDYSPMKSKGIDTVSEIAVRSLALSGDGFVKPDLSVNLNAQVRLISTSDNRELFTKGYACSSREYEFKVWAENDARKFREEIERCYEDIAENAVKDLFVNDTLIPKSNLERNKTAE